MEAPLIHPLRSRERYKIAAHFPSPPAPNKMRLLIAAALLSFLLSICGAQFTPPANASLTACKFICAQTFAQHLLYGQNGKVNYAMKLGCR